jgi:hypothetical protein
LLTPATLVIEGSLELPKPAYGAGLRSGAMTITVVAHPTWCDRARCTATPAATIGETRQSTPARFTADVLAGHLDLTATLSQAHTPWLTTPYVNLEFVELEQDRMPVTGTVRLIAEQAADLGRFLSELAGTATSARAAQVAAYLSALREEVRS